VRAESSGAVVVFLLGALPGPAWATGTGFSVVDAVWVALDANPAIRLQRAVVLSSIGDSEVAAGRFDWVVASSIDQQVIDTPITEQLATKTNLTTLSAGLTKQFEWGMSVSPTIQLQRTDVTLPAGLSSTVGPNSSAIVNLHVSQPILRNFGSASSAEYRAALLQAEAANHDLQEVIAERVLAVVLAYWRYVGATKNLEVLVAAEDRAQQILSDGKALVRADERPAADLAQLEANLADRMRARIDAEQVTYDARIALAVEMGIDLEKGAALPPPTTAAPEPPRLELNIPVGRLIEGALARRQDLASAKARTSASAILVAQAENALLPELDVVGDIGYMGLVNAIGGKDFFLPVVKNAPGVNAHIGLLLRWPVTAIEARGFVHRATAGHQENEIARNDLARRIGLNVASRATALNASTRSLARAKAAAASYKTAVENERTKLKSGLSTIIDVILTEDKMTNARLNEISDQERYAELVAQLAFEAGTITEPEGERAIVDEVHLMSIPNAEVH
jgi:outer membrane protein TolC